MSLYVVIWDRISCLHFFVVLTGTTLKPSTEYFHFSTKWNEAGRQLFAMLGSANHWL